jgi:hypothetical protein
MGYSTIGNNNFYSPPCHIGFAADGTAAGFPAYVMRTCRNGSNHPGASGNGSGIAANYNDTVL